MIKSRFHPARRRAFTLIESMATVAVLATLGSIASFVLLDALGDYAKSVTSAQLHAEVSIALDRAMREIRMIDLDGGAASQPAPNITDINAAGDTIQWTDDASAAYSLAKSGSDLMLEVAGGGADILLSDVTAFSVQAYDDDNAVLANPLTGAGCDDIRRVELTITAARDGVSESQRSRVFICSTMSGGG
jgi:prepilin-type N-terminal cleavage/methylation domain-containing protein